MRRSSRFWLVYMVAWLPFAASYFTLFRSHLGRSVFESLKASLFNVFPAALLAVGIVVACRHLPWSRADRNRFFLVHFLLISLYGFLWLVSPSFLNAIDQRIEHGSWNFRLGGTFQGGVITAVMIYLAVAGIVYALQTNEKLRGEEARATRAESLRARAELEALRSQLNPHFLFNTLHSLMALVRHDPTLAEEALEKLATLLRHTLITKQDAEDVSLSEEFDFIQNYLDLEQIRLGDRLRFESKIEPEALHCRLPPLTLQPLVENSVKHAISTQTEGALLTIRAQRRNGSLMLEVSDNGPGADPDLIGRSDGAGIRIAQQRLAIRFGERASFKVITRPQEGFTVRMELPVD